MFAARPICLGLSAIGRATANTGSTVRDGLPVPPLRLVQLVSGVSDLRTFFEGGKAAVDSIISLLQKNGLELSDVPVVLDFGCGCGRVLRNLLPFAPNCKIYGCDLNPILIDWCKTNIPGVTFFNNSLVPPLSLNSESIDLIYGLSVFTHLPVDLQHNWILELARVLRQKGKLILSTHGEAYLGQLTSKEQEIFAKGDIVIREEGSVGGNYFAAYHPKEAFEKMIAGKFMILDFIQEGAKGNPRQDLYLLAKR